MQYVKRLKLEWIIVFAVLALVGAILSQCGTEDTAGENTTPCAKHEDCPVEMNCIIDQGICGQDPNGIPCTSDYDCVSDYTCYIPIDSVDGTGKCIPGDSTPDGDQADGDEPATCTSNDDCDEDEICVNGYCDLKFPPCNSNAECWPGQVCNPDKGICEGEPVDGDEDEVEDGDQAEVEVTDGDETDSDEAVDGDDPVDGDDQPGECERSSDCPTGYVCPNGTCVQHCSDGGCNSLPGSHCNPNNGFCEYCDDLCAQDRCCNFYWETNDSFWYCGSCCVPPCATGSACQSGQCVELKCPSCQPDQECNASTGYTCKDNGQPDGDGGERGGMNCLPANAECIDGVDTCCSGTCLMGTCL
ncbi:MAG: hypothetical protein C4523_11140 [Myxococcales bacterium]|nr:MAG: hypothetical protein C4523_11140 [Myxococcales bacterium]